MGLGSWLAISFLLWLVAALWFIVNRNLSRGRLILAGFGVLFWPIFYDAIVGVFGFIFAIVMAIIGLFIGGVLLAVGIPLAFVAWGISVAILLVIGKFVLLLLGGFLAAMGFGDYFFEN